MSSTVKASRQSEHVGFLSRGAYVAAVLGTTSLDENAKATAPEMCRVIKVTAEGALVRPAKDEHIKSTTVEIPLANIVCNFGVDPAIKNRVFGYDFSSRYVGSKEHSKFGDVHFFYEPDPEAGKKLWKAFDVVYGCLKDRGLQTMTELPIVYEAVSRKTYLGMFKMPGDVDKAPARCIINSGHYEEISLPLLTHCIAHELAGHGVDHFYLYSNPQLRAKWYDLYVQTALCGVPNREELNDLRKIVLANKTMKDVSKELADDPDRTALLRNVVSFLRKVRGVDSFTMNLIMTADLELKRDRLREIWPSVPDFVSHKKLAPIVSEYATKETGELVAESLAMALLGTKLDKRAEKLAEQSFEFAAKRNRLMQSAIASQDPLNDVIRSTVDH